MALRPLRYALINGVGYSWASVHLSITCESTGKSLNLDQAGYSSINFARTRERGVAHGPHPDPLFKTRGQNTYEASIKFYMSALNYFIQETLGGAGYGDRFFDVELQYLEDGLDPVTISIRGCTLDTDKVDNAKGTDATEVEVELNPLKYLRNGLDDVDSPLAA